MARLAHDGALWQTLSAAPYAFLLSNRSLGRAAPAPPSGSALYDPTTLERSHIIFGCKSSLLPSNNPATGPPTRSEIQIDGANAYDPTAADSVHFQANNGNVGLRAETLKRHFDVASGEVEVEESNPLVKCSPEAVFPPTESSCKEFVTTGVELKRKWRTIEAGLVISMTDTWKSTDGQPHTVSALYDQELATAASNGAYELPGAGAFAALLKSSTPSLPSGPGMILYKESANTSEVSNGTDPQGAIVYDSSPGEPLQVYSGSNEPNASAFEMPYQRAIAPGSARILRMAFVQAYGLAQVRSLAAAALASYTPTIAIASPASGATVSDPNITVAGSASDAVAVSSVTVNGQSASLGGGGSWSQGLTLTPGANTITATVTNQSGATATATVTYTPVEATRASPPPASPASPTVTQVGSPNATKGVVKLTLACHGVSGQRCHVDVSLSTLEKLLGSRLIGISAARRHSKRVSLAALRLTIPAGTSVTSTLSLGAAGKRLLARFGKLPAHLTAILQDEGRRTTVIAQNVTIKPPPKKRAKH